MLAQYAYNLILGKTASPHRSSPYDELTYQWHDFWGAGHSILDELNLKHDREGNERTAYSLLHTYVCMRLMEGADIYQIAKNCRISVEMIEKHYAAHIKNTLDTTAINVRRDRRPAPIRRAARKAKEAALE